MNYVEKAIEKIGEWSSYLVLLLIGLIIGIIIGRTFFDSNIIGAQELAIYFHATFFMIGISYGSYHNSHTRVDIFSNTISKVGNYWIELFGILLFLFPMCLLILYLGIDYVIESSWKYQEASSNTGGLKNVYILKSIIPLSALLVLGREFVYLLRIIRCLRLHYS